MGPASAASGGRPAFAAFSRGSTWEAAGQCTKARTYFTNPLEPAWAITKQVHPPVKAALDTSSEAVRYRQGSRKNANSANTAETAGTTVIAAAVTVGFTVTSAAITTASAVTAGSITTRTARGGCSGRCYQRRIPRFLYSTHNSFHLTLKEYMYIYVLFQYYKVHMVPFV